MLNVDKYLTMQANWEPSLGFNEDFQTEEYGAVSTLKCFIYGELKEIRSDVGYEFISTQNYVSNNLSVKRGDKLDGMVVHEIKQYFDFPGIKEYKGNVYVAVCW